MSIAEKAIAARIKWLREHQFDPEILQAVAYIRKQAKDVLVQANKDSEELGLDPATFTMSDALQEAFETFRDQVDDALDQLLLIEEENNNN